MTGPHTIPYHGGLGLSSATGAFISYQPVAFLPTTIDLAQIGKAMPATRKPTVLE
jgi:hypothetical protein